jgi:hypothetical protein
METSSNAGQPLSDSELASLKAVSLKRDISGAHRQKLQELGLIELGTKGWAVTALGQARLTPGTHGA